MLLVLEGDVDALEVQLGRACGLYDGYGGLLQVVYLHDEVAHLFQL